MSYLSVRRQLLAISTSDINQEIGENCVGGADLQEDRKYMSACKMQRLSMTHCLLYYVCFFWLKLYLVYICILRGSSSLKTTRATRLNWSNDEVM